MAQSGTAPQFDPEDWMKHLTVTFDRDKNTVEIGWACDCGGDPCTVPHTPTLTLVVCPSKPCPKH
jgi:hypothetical protein